MTRKKWLGTLLAVVVLGAFCWMLAGADREPRYQGRALSHWLEGYNQAGSTAGMEPVSEAVRAIGPEALPHLLRRVTHREASLKAKLLGPLRKQRMIRLAALEPDRLRSPSIMALKALGAEAEPVVGDLLHLLLEDDWHGSYALLAIGPAARPAFEAACRSTNANVRTTAALMLAMVSDGGRFNGFSWGWDGSGVSGRPRLTLGFAVLEENTRTLARQLQSQDAAVRQASAEALARYRGRTAPKPFVTSALLSAVEDEHAAVRQAARQAWKQIDPEAALEAGVP